jgi:isopenicillin-N epimerase
MYYCKQKGAKYIRQKTTLPLVSKQQFIDEFVKGITPKTKMLFISHITSTTGLILPVAELCAIAKQKGLLTFVDGAHAPGHVELNLQNIQADIYIGACHKWMMTPKGSSFIYVRKELQHLFDPLIVSWGYDSAVPSTSRFLDYHQMSGTRDFSSYLTIPTALEFMQQNNWPAVAAQCRALVKHNAARFCEVLKSAPLCPLTDDFLGQMLSIPIATSQPDKLQQRLYQHYKIEVPIMRLDNKIFIRYSIQSYNTQQDLDVLFNAVKELVAEKELL